eukprot:TRINITY_DN2078_c0_g1_i1.p1 TRINITY_DN2078_c0_g1~~TRINITY_DN2078_c0_g1_i1.p1  ORF type:complete len:134 (-),score=24.97 TRINITY_DN2078_c0_g1_i1:73-426(-)
MSTVRQIFDNINARVQAQGAQLVNEIDGVFIFEISGGPDEGTWIIDLKNGTGSVKKTAATSEQTDSGVTISLASADFIDVFTGKANANALWATGKLTLEGNMALAMKLQTLTAGSKL